jgi:hypothetical protein
LELVSPQNLPALPRLTKTACLGPAHAVYFATYEAVKHVMGGNKAGVHHPLAAATSGACATIASDALMNPFDGMARPVGAACLWAVRLTRSISHQAANADS